MNNDKYPASAARHAAGSHTIRKTSKPKKSAKRVLQNLLSVILVIAMAGSAGFFYYFGGVETGTYLPDDLGQASVGDGSVTNIALFGVDTRNANAVKGLSDSIIIVSIDNSSHTVKMTSILRDSYVAVPGKGSRKINAAYSLGGASLAIKTLNTNFNLDISNYATVNFALLIKIIDELGGVEINLTETERLYINNNMLPSESGHDKTPIAHSGLVNLNGSQALMYSRIRKIDSDTKRAGRQQTVIKAMLTKFRSLPATKMASVARSILGMVETSLTYADIVNYFPLALADDLEIVTKTIPGAEEGAVGTTINGSWVWSYDIAAAADRLHLFIYGEEE